VQFTVIAGSCLHGWPYQLIVWSVWRYLPLSCACCWGCWALLPMGYTAVLLAVAVQSWNGSETGQLWLPVNSLWLQAGKQSVQAVHHSLLPYLRYRSIIFQRTHYTCTCFCASFCILQPIVYRYCLIALSTLLELLLLRLAVKRRCIWG